MLHVMMGSSLWLHASRGTGAFRSHIDADGRACYLAYEQGEVYGYGRFECDTSTSYKSVLARGTIEVRDDAASKLAFFDALMAKYAPHIQDRPKGFYPRLEEIVVFVLTLESLSGKQIALPPIEGRWPRLDRTRSPKVPPPA